MIRCSRLRFVLIAALFTVVISGCVPPAIKIEPIVYPKAPEEPKIVFLNSYSGALDFREPSFLDSLIGGPPTRGLSAPYGVAAEGDKIYVSLTGNPSIAVVDLKERMVSYFGDSGQDRLKIPIGIAISSEGEIFVSDADNKAIYVYNDKGELTRKIGKPSELIKPSGLALDKNLKRLYVADSYAHSVKVYTLTGEKLFEIGSVGTGDGQLYFPTNVAIDARTGNIFVADTQNFRVQRFDRDGKFMSKFGEVGDNFGNFARPKGIAVDSEGHVYVADAAFGNFQIFMEDGQYLMFIPAADFKPGLKTLLAGMFIDDQDRIYVADQLNGRVQVFQYLSDAWKKNHPDEYRKYVELSERPQKVKKK